MKLIATIFLAILSLSLVTPLVDSAVFSDTASDELSDSMRSLAGYSNNEKTLQTLEEHTSYQKRNISSFSPSDLNFLDLEFAPGELIVKYTTTEARSNSFQNVDQQFGLKNAENAFEAKSGELSKIYKLKFSKDADVLSLAKAYALDPNVEYAEPNYLYYTSMTPNDLSYSQQWAHRKMQSEQAWNIQRGSSNVIIAIVDSGVDWNHPDLAGNIWNNIDEVVDGIDNDGNGYIDDIRGYDFVETTSNVYPGEDGTVRDNDPMDFSGHGTHCAGIAAAVTNNSLGIAGMNWYSKIMPVRAGFQNYDGRGLLENDDCALAIEYAAINNATIISMSWGGGGTSKLIQDAINFAYSKGVVLVAAAGNENTHYRKYPAAYDNVIGVAATDSLDQKAFFSNYGSWIDVAAPGVDIVSTVFDNAYDSWDGTSMATPYVAGLAALILSRFPNFSNDQVLNILRSTTDPVVSSEYIGLGRINANNAILRSTILSVNLDSSLDDANIVGMLNIRGTAQGNNFRRYVVEYGLGSYPSSWTKIAESTSPIANGILATWDTSSVSVGKYSIRLTAYDTSGRITEDRTIVYVKTSIIQKAINQAAVGATVLIPAGTYYENVLLNKTVTLLGTNAENTIINGGPIGNVVTITSPNVRLSGFTITGASEGIIITSTGNKITGNIVSENDRNMVIIGGGNNIIAQNTLGNCHVCIDIGPAGNMPSVNNTIENNYIEWFGYGISLYGSRNNSINLNDFSTYEDSCPMYLGQHYTGYEYLYSDYNTISDNDFSGGPPIIEFSHSSNNTISRNQMGGWGALLLHSASNNNNIINNTINGCLQAIEIYSCNQNIIRGNHFEGDPSVIYFFQCFNNSIIENTFVNNGDYLQFSNSSYNKIYHNNFFQDYPPIIDAISQNIWDNGYPSGGNYWSGYTGIDANHDGIGDTPYVIDANNIDRYPLMNPWESQISANAYLVARGLDNVIYYRTWDTSTDTWLPWNSLPGVTCDSIAATVYDNRLHLVVRGLDGNSLWHGIVKLTDNSFSGWVYLDGASSSAPTLTSDDTTMCLVVRGLDNAIYYRTFNPFSNNWNAWSSLPGTTCDSPSAALLDGKLHIVVRGLDGNSLWHSTTDIASDAFSGWQIVEGATNSKPTLTASDGNDQVYLVVRGLDSVIYYKTWTAQGWLGWSAIMQGISCDGPAATTNENKLYLIVRGADGNSIYYGAVQLPTKAFSGWTNLSGITPSKPTLT